VATLDDVAKIALSLPEVVEGERHGGRIWGIPGKKDKLSVFAWERGYSKADLKRFGDVVPPQGPNLAVRVADLHTKEAILAEGAPGFFTIEHFNNYPLLLVQLRTVRKPALRDAIVDAWLTFASDAVAEAYLAKRRRRPAGHDGRR
jgi:hypothetical protein